MSKVVITYCDICGKKIDYEWKSCGWIEMNKTHEVYAHLRKLSFHGIITFTKYNPFDKEEVMNFCIEHKKEAIKLLYDQLMRVKG